MAQLSFCGFAPPQKMRGRQHRGGRISIRLRGALREISLFVPFHCTSVEMTASIGLAQ